MQLMLAEDLKVFNIHILKNDHIVLYVLFSGGSKRGTPSTHLHMDQNFLNFMQFLGKFVCWHLSLEGWRPLLW